MHVARFGKCQDQHCHECSVQKCNSKNATKRMFRHIYVIFSGKSSCSIWIFFMVAQYQLRHKITCRILNLKYAGKKKGMGKESLTVSMETNLCIVDPINCRQWPLRTQRQLSETLQNFSYSFVNVSFALWLAPDDSRHPFNRPIR